MSSRVPIMSFLLWLDRISRRLQLARTHNNQKPALLRKLFALHVELLEDRVVPAGTFTWQGTTSGLWSVGSNWVGGNAPTDNDGTDILIFPKSPGSGSGAKTIDNDLSGSFASIDFEDNYTVTGTLGTGP